MKSSSAKSLAGRLVQHVLVAAGALALTLVFFLVLPLIQAIGEAPEADLLVQSVDVAELPPPPPPPPEEEPEEEPEPEEPPPELEEEAPPLDLEQLELALNPGFGDGWMNADFAIQLDGLAPERGSLEALSEMAELDQEPRAVYTPQPVLTAKLRKSAPATVWLLLVVDERGRVETARVQSSTNPIYESPALTAIQQWKFEPGKRNGEPVRGKVRLPMTFPKS